MYGLREILGVGSDFSLSGFGGFALRLTAQDRTLPFGWRL